MTPERRWELVAMAYEALHRSCATTPSGDYLDPGVARAIALGYLELALMPTAIWGDQFDPASVTAGVTS